MSKLVRSRRASIASALAALLVAAGAASGDSETAETHETVPTIPIIEIDRALAAPTVDGGEPSAERAGGAPAPAPPRPLAEDLDLERLMGRLAAMRGLRAHYREEKRIALLSDSLVSEGWLYVVPPDRILLRTETPAPARLEIQGDRLVMEDELGREEIDLAGQQAARQFVDHMLLVFTGDLELMRQRYDLEYSAELDDWTLVLEPRDRLMRRIVSKIELVGNGPMLLEMALSEPDGDATVTFFDRVEVDRVFSTEEVAALFAAGASGSATARGAAPSAPDADGTRATAAPGPATAEEAPAR